MRSLLLLLSLFIISTTNAQQDFNNEEGVLLYSVTLGFHSSAGDLEKRFGRSLSVGSALEWISKNNLIYGLDGSIFFGNVVKEDVLANLRTPEGEIIGNTRSYADVVTRQRGFYAGAHFGKLFNLLKDNNRSGIRATMSVGIWQHKIRIQDDPQSFVPQLDKEYKRGYDRLTNGLTLNEFIGYQHLSSNRLINFYAGIDIYQGFTKSRRDFNFDTMMKDDQSRLDLKIGFKMGWSLPFYLGEKSEELYY